MTKVDRYYLQSDPEVIVRVDSPALVTLWVPTVIDMEDESFENSRVYVTIDDSDRCRLWKGTPLMFEMFHTFQLEKGQVIWGCTRDQALIGIKVESVS